MSSPSAERGIDGQGAIPKGNRSELAGIGSVVRREATAINSRIRDVAGKDSGETRSRRARVEALFFPPFMETRANAVYSYHLTADRSR